MDEQFCTIQNPPSSLVVSKSVVHENGYHSDVATEANVPEPNSVLWIFRTGLLRAEYKLLSNPFVASVRFPRELGYFLLGRLNDLDPFAENAIH